MNSNCECGCGQPVTIITKTNAAQGRVKGQPNRYIVGHISRVRSPGYTIHPITNCWNWNGYIAASGYALGARSSHGVIRQGPMHRFFYEQANGPIPRGLVLDHLCRNKGCVNPAHLEPVTQKINLRRAARLCMEHVQAIRALRDSGMSQSAIAKQFTIHQSHVSRIISGDRWS